MTSSRPGSRLADNQPPPLVGHNVVTSDLALTEAVTRHATAEVLDDLIPLGAEAGSAEAREHGVLANTHRPELTTYDRYGNRIDEVAVPPVVALAAGSGRRARPPGRALGVRLRARPCPPGRRLHGLVAHRARPRLPDLDDVRRRARPAHRRRAGQGVGAGARRDDLRPRHPPARRQGRSVGRDGDDREAGRLRRPRQRDRGAADRRRRRVLPARAQVVHLRPDERRVPGAGPGRGRPVVLRGAAGAP